MRSIWLRLAITAVVLVGALVYVSPTFFGSEPGAGATAQNEGSAKEPSDEEGFDPRIKLGLDLRGGIHLTLGVGVQEAMANQLDQTGQDIRSIARDAKVIVLAPRATGQTLTFELLKPEQRSELESILSDDFAQLEIVSTERLANDRTRYTLALRPAYAEEFAEMTVDQAVKTIRNRIDEFGVAEPDIRKQQDNRIQVQLPGLSDPERAIELIGQTAVLEFKMVDDEVDPARAVGGMVPPGREVLQMQPRPGQNDGDPVVLRSETLLSGEYITDAGTRFDQFNQPYVVMDFNPRGARIFERITAENIGKRLAIILDGTVYSTPTIQERIGGGAASITGTFSLEEAKDLAIVLRAGSLPAPVTILEQRTVGPTLGQESIEAGVMSAIIGMLSVLVFMVIYYGVAGAIADVALLFNILLIMAGLAGFGATLTLPGIAGIILTIGMAIDANVIIFERIREELRNGLTARAAIEEGYSRATLTIVDANVTTIIAAIILYEFGTGPIRGFAVTLTLGILASMFTAIFVSRLLFDLHLKNAKPGAKLNV